MKVSSEEVIKEFGLSSFGAKGWYTSSELDCPECSRKGKLGLKFTDGLGAVHCFYCDYTEGIIKYLKRVKRTDLISFEQQVTFSKKLRTLKEENEEEIELPEVSLPKGFQRIEFDEYLDNRNFKAHQYEQFEVGVTNNFLVRKLKNYLIFIIKQQGKRVGWLARSKYSYEWHVQNLKDYKEGKCELVLRYINSTKTDFGNLLGGFDEITGNTEELILVEGLFDKTNVSNLLETEKSERLKVLCTFGNKVSDEQIKLLKTTNVRKITLLYDYGTLKQVKQYSTELSRWFDSYACEFPLILDERGEPIDPGNVDSKNLNEILSNSKNFLYFYNSKVINKINR